MARPWNQFIPATNPHALPAPPSPPVWGLGQRVCNDLQTIYRSVYPRRWFHVLVWSNCPQPHVCSMTQTPVCLWATPPTSSRCVHPCVWGSTITVRARVGPVKYSAPPQPSPCWGPGHAFCYLVQSPHVLTLGFLLFPFWSPPRSFPQPAGILPWDRKSWVKLRTGPFCGVCGFPYVCFGTEGPRGGCRQLGGWGSSHGQGREHMF